MSTYNLKKIKEEVVKYEMALVKNDFAKSLKNIIEISECSQNKIASIIDMDKSTFSKVLNGKRNLKKTDLLRILKFLKIKESISLEIFDYNGTTIKTNENDDILIRWILANNEINTLKKVNQMIIELKIKS